MLTVPLVARAGRRGRRRRPGDALVLAAARPRPARGGAQRGHARGGEARGRRPRPDGRRRWAGISAWATAGALTGTFATGFVLVPLLSTRTSVLAVGGAVRRRRARARRGAARSAAAWRPALVRGRRRASPRARPATATARTSARRSWPTRPRSPGACSCSTTCATPTSTCATRATSSSRTRAGSATSSTPTRPRDAVFIGGGGFTLPRYLLATRSPALGRDRARARPRAGRPGPQDELGLRESAAPARRRRRRARASCATLPGRLRRPRRRRRVRRALDPVAPGDERNSSPTCAASCARRRLRDQRHRPRRPRPLRAPRSRRCAASSRTSGSSRRATSAATSCSSRPTAPLPRARDPRRAGGWQRLAGDADPLTDDHAPADQLLTPTR